LTHDLLRTTYRHTADYLENRRLKVKTVLAPNAPWPKFDKEGKVVAKPKRKPKPKAPPPKKSPSKIKRTDDKYIEWADKNLARIFK